MILLLIGTLIEPNKSFAKPLSTKTPTPSWSASSKKRSLVSENSWGSKASTSKRVRKYIILFFSRTLPITYYERVCTRRLISRAKYTSGPDGQILRVVYTRDKERKWSWQKPASFFAFGIRILNNLVHGRTYWFNWGCFCFPWRLLLLLAEKCLAPSKLHVAYSLFACVIKMRKKRQKEPNAVVVRVLIILFIYISCIRNQENRGENGAQGALQRPRLASVPSRAEDAVDQLQENEKLIAGEFVWIFLWSS